MTKRALQQVWLKWSGRCLCLTIMLASASLQAQPAGNHIVDEAVDASDANTMRIEIRFVMPVNYLWYFPHSQKDDFLIAIQPLPGLANYDMSIREHIRIPNSLSTVIKDLYYDGTEDSGRFVVLETNQDVGIGIKQGRDMKSIIIEFASMAPKPASDCDGTPKTGEQNHKQK